MAENINNQIDVARQELGPRETLAFWVFAAIVFAVGCIFYNLKPCNGATIEQWGQFGDSFGMINWIISLLSMCGVAYTAYIMKEQLDNQRETNNKQLMYIEGQLQEQQANNRRAAERQKLSALFELALAELRTLPEAIVSRPAGIAASLGEVTSHVYVNGEKQILRDEGKRALEIEQQRKALKEELARLKGAIRALN